MLWSCPADLDRPPGHGVRAPVAPASSGRPVRGQPLAQAVDEEARGMKNSPTRRAGSPHCRDFRHSAPASAVTLGRAFVDHADDAQGRRTRWICRPLGLSHSAMTAPPDSSCAATARRPAVMPVKGGSRRAATVEHRRRQRAPLVAPEFHVFPVRGEWISSLPRARPPRPRIRGLRAWASGCGQRPSLGGRRPVRGGRCRHPPSGRECLASILVHRWLG